MINRRDLLAVLGAAWIAPWARGRGEQAGHREEMFGLIGKIVAAPGRREELAEILVEGTQGMPGCISYVVALDASDPDALWVTEVWSDRESHRASLSLPAVQAAITKGRPLIAAFENRAETIPLAGHGLETGR